jgi:hypothetical protein
VAVLRGRPTTVCRTDPAPDLRARRLALGGGGLRSAEAGSAHRGSAAAALALIPGCATVRRGRLGLQTLTAALLYGLASGPWANWAKDGGNRPTWARQLLRGLAGPGACDGPVGKQSARLTKQRLHGPSGPGNRWAEHLSLRTRRKAAGKGRLGRAVAYGPDGREACAGPNCCTGHINFSFISVIF